MHTILTYAFKRFFYGCITFIGGELVVESLFPYSKDLPADWNGDFLTPAGTARSEDPGLSGAREAAGDVPAGKQKIGMEINVINCRSVLTTCRVDEWVIE